MREVPKFHQSIAVFGGSKDTLSDDLCRRIAEAILRHYRVLITGMSLGVPHAVLEATINAIPAKNKPKGITFVGISPYTLDGYKENALRESPRDWFDAVYWGSAGVGASKEVKEVAYKENIIRLMRASESRLFIAGGPTTEVELHTALYSAERGGGSAIGVLSTVEGSSVRTIRAYLEDMEHKPWWLVVEESPEILISNMRRVQGRIWDDEQRRLRAKQSRYAGN